MKTRLTIHLFGRHINAFHFFGVLGFIGGAALGIALGNFCHLRLAVMLYLTLTSAAVSFLLAIVAKWITGEETIVYYHHEIAILVSCALLLRALREPILPYLDITVLGIGTLLAFGRLGCHSVGCCYGRPAEKGVVYSHAHVEAGFAAVTRGCPSPVQLIESAFVFLTVITGTFLILHHSPPGTTLIVYTLIYGSFRFGMEFFRGDADRPYWLALSEAQWTTLILMLVCTSFSIVGWFPFYWWEMAVSTAVLLSRLDDRALWAPETNWRKGHKIETERER